ncbi:pectate lyase [Parvularcula flava]|uniref:Pectate lyase n=1 Tax=Aquisalinus luteolus TaxID=1566827 RepID=A0A8J3A1Q5_9PROT|nr:pectate lyase [Aquisalinus luteolus]NHK26440.1 pectate lyase [Aquisalinus luteolus]GGH92340.1 pectate lyase [Aquisalinus luteolus]
MTLLAVLFGTLLIASCGNSAHSQETDNLAFEGAMGWAATTPGGRGGEIIRVTNLDAEGEGSLRAALEAEGPRIVVFEVGGVIDLDSETIRVSNPFVTIAGQTAPSPGITIIKGGITFATNDVIMQHIRIRSGQGDHAYRSGFDVDNISTADGAYNIIVDHCSFTWATDENLSASGSRFNGDTPDEWRLGTTHDITYSHNIIAEGLAYASHAKGEHSKGSLIHDNVNNILIYGNLYAHNYERNPLFKGGVRGAIVNNFIYNPGSRAIHYNLQGLEWGDVPPENGRMAVIGNAMRAGPDTQDSLALVMLGGQGDLEIYMEDNIAVDRAGYDINKLGRYTTGTAEFIELDAQPEIPNLPTVLPADETEEYVLRNVGARPWDRDYNDVRILADSAEGRGEIIDNESEVGGFPVQEMTRKPFNPDDWNLNTMEPKSPDVLDSGNKAKGT